MLQMEMHIGNIQVKSSSIGFKSKDIVSCGENGEELLQSIADWVSKEDSNKAVQLTKMT